MGKQRKKYTLDFKRDAVRMMRNRGTRTVAQVGDDLGVSGNQLHRWAKELDKDVLSKRNEQEKPWRTRTDGCARRTSA
jgi:transposase-like protein